MDQHSGQVVVPTWPHVLSSAPSIVASRCVGSLDADEKSTNTYNSIRPKHVLDLEINFINMLVTFASTQAVV